MKSQPLLIMAAFFLVLAVGSAVLLHVTDTPVSLIVSIIAATAPIVGIVATVHGQVYSQATVDKIAPNNVAILADIKAEENAKL